MNLFDVTGVTSHKVQVQTEIGKLAWFSDKEFDQIQNETVLIILERSGANNLNITKAELPLRDYILALTYGKEAVGSFNSGHYESFKTAVITELCFIGNVELGVNDKITIQLNNLDATKRYVCDGLIMPDNNDDISDILVVEEKILDQNQKDLTINVDKSEVVVMDDLQSIKEVNLTHSNGRVTKHTMRELRVMSLDNDPVAMVRQSGYVQTGYNGKLQIETKNITAINVVKTEGTAVRMVLLFDLQQQQLGYVNHVK